jgi:hypothetical protein
MDNSEPHANLAVAMIASKTGAAALATAASMHVQKGGRSSRQHAQVDAGLHHTKHRTWLPTLGPAAAAWTHTELCVAAANEGAPA